MRVITPALLILLLASCKKQYTCNCTIRDPYAEVSLSDTYKEPSKKKAEARCKKLGAAQETDGKVASCGLQ